MKLNICYLAENRDDNQTKPLDPKTAYITTTPPDAERDATGYFPAIYVKNIQSVIILNNDELTIYVWK